MRREDTGSRTEADAAAFERAHAEPEPYGAGEYDDYAEAPSREERAARTLEDDVCVDLVWSGQLSWPFTTRLVADGTVVEVLLPTELDPAQLVDWLHYNRYETKVAGRTLSVRRRS